MQSEIPTQLRLVPAEEIPLQTIKVCSRPRLSEKEANRVPIVDQIFHCLIMGVLGFAVYWVASHFLMQSVQVEGRSMVPTLQPTENYFLNRWIYSLRDPQPNDIIVLKDPQDKVWEVKRIIATAGESVYIKKGAVYVDGQPLKESYLSPGTKTYAAETADEFICCGENQYYVLGDNRGISRDSRYFGPVRREEIVGKLIH